MENLWLGLLIVIILLVCVIWIWSARCGGLTVMRRGEKARSGRLESMENEYGPMSMLEKLRQIFLSRIGEKDIELIFDIDKNMPLKLYGDETRIYQVISNLLNYAVQHTEKGYIRLLIKIYPVIENELIEMYVSVKDTGRGMDKEDLHRLFETRRKVIARGKSRSGGNIEPELPASRRLIEEIGGELHVKSEEGNGSEYWFSVRQKTAEPAMAAVIKPLEGGRAPRVSAKFSNSFREEALLAMINMYKVSFIPYDILLDVGLRADYLFTDSETYCELEQEMTGSVKEKTSICVLYNPVREQEKLPEVTMMQCPFFSLDFCRLLNHEE